MKRLSLMSSILALSLAMCTPAALGHVGHGDEFKAEGGVNRVEVNAQTDSLLGIQVSPIESAADGKVMIPVSALVEDNGRQLVFVQYENFYEPVPVNTGATQGELVEVLDGVSANEQLVTEGSLSLYAESRKTQTAEAEPEAATLPTSDKPAEESAAKTTDAGDSQVAEKPAEAAESSDGLPVGLIAAVGAGAALVVGAAVVLGGRKKKSTLS